MQSKKYIDGLIVAEDPGNDELGHHLPELPLPAPLLEVEDATSGDALWWAWPMALLLTVLLLVMVCLWWRRRKVQSAGSDRVTPFEQAWGDLEALGQGNSWKIGQVAVVCSSSLRGYLSGELGETAHFQTLPELLNTEGTMAKLPHQLRADILDFLQTLDGLKYRADQEQADARDVDRLVKQSRRLLERLEEQASSQKSMKVSTNG